MKQRELHDTAATRDRSKRRRRKRRAARFGRRGRLFDDRYHAEVITTPTQMRRALAYVLNNARRHARGRAIAPGWVDPYSPASSFGGWRGRLRPVAPPVDGEASTPTLPAARTWLLRIGWSRAGPIHIDSTAGR